MVQFESLYIIYTASWRAQMRHMPCVSLYACTQLSPWRYIEKSDSCFLVTRSAVVVVVLCFPPGMTQKCVYLCVCVCVGVCVEWSLCVFEYAKTGHWMDERAGHLLCKTWSLYYIYITYMKLYDSYIWKYILQCLRSIFPLIGMCIFEGWKATCFLSLSLIWKKNLIHIYLAFKLMVF